MIWKWAPPPRIGGSSAPRPARARTTLLQLVMRAKAEGRAEAKAEYLVLSQIYPYARAGH